MSRLDDAAKVRLVVCPDSEALERLRQDARRDAQVASKNHDLHEQLASYAEELSSWARQPMRLEVSTDDGETWRELPTTGGIRFSCPKDGWPTVDVSVLIAGGFGTIVPVRLPPMPGDEDGGST